MAISWLKKRVESSATLALCPREQGISAVAISRSRAQPVLEWADYVEAANGDRAREKLLAELLKENQANDLSTTALIAERDYNLLLVESPGVPAGELREAVRWRVKDLIDFNIEDAVVDIFEVPPLKGGRDNMLYAVVAKRAAVRAVIDEIEAAEQSLQTVDVPELALRNIATLLPEDVGGVAFIYLNDDSGLITVTRQGTLYLSRRFDGGRAQLFASGAGAVGPENEGTLDAIVIEVQRSLDYYESQFAQPPIQGVVIAPLGRPLDGIDAYLGSQLGIPARVLSFADVIETQVELSSETEARCITALGAALRNQVAA